MMIQSQFFQFRTDDKTAVAVLLPVVAVVVHVVLFRRIERFRRVDPGDDGDVIACRFIGNGFFRSASLGFVMVEDDASVLGADIFPLTVELGGIVKFEEPFQQGFVGDESWVVHDADGFRMARFPRADFFIGRVFFAPPHVSRSGGENAGKLREGGFRTPKTARPEIGNPR